MGVVRVKDGVQFTMIGPGGFRILSAIDQCAKSLDLDLRITSACDGTHSGPEDPHHRGVAFDVGSHEFVPTQKSMILDRIMGILGFERFYGFLESPNTGNEHFHFQVKKGTEFP